MDLRHYYHVYADGDYRRMVQEHFTALKASGLLDSLAHLHVGFVGSEKNVSEARYLALQLIGPRFASSSAATGWEQETLNCLHADAGAASQPFLALYAHTKGAANQSEINEVWRRVMTRYNIDEWKEAIANIRGNVGATGCLWASFDNGRLIGAPDTQYFAGTFWWARSDALAKLCPPAKSYRHGAEVWIGGITKLSEPYDVHCLLDVPITIEALQPHAPPPRDAGRAGTDFRQPS